MDLSVPALQLGSQAILVNRSSELCMGKINGGARVCLADAATCHITAHKNKFIPGVVDPFIMVSGPPGRNSSPTAHTEHCLPIALLDDDLVSHLLEVENQDLGGIINLIWSQGIISVSDLESQLKAPLTARKRLVDMDTPARVNSRNDVKDNIKNLESIQSRLGSLFNLQAVLDHKDKMAELTDDDKEYKNSFDQLVSEISKGLDGVVKTLRSSIQGFSMHAELRGQEFEDLFKVVKDLGAALDKLSGSVGSRKRSAEEAGITEPSLWSCAVATRLHLKKHEKALKDLATPVEKLIGDVSQLFHKLENISTSKNDGDAVMDEDEDEEEDDNLFGRNFFNSQGKRTIVGGILPAGGYATGSELEGIRVSGSNIGGNNRNTGGSGSGNNRGGGGFSGGAGGGGGDDGGGNGRSPFDDTPEDLTQLLVNLENRIKNLEKGEGESLDHVHWENHIFHTPEDIGALFEGVMGLGEKDIKFSCFTNPVALLDACTRRISPNIKSAKDIKDILALDLRQREVHAYLSIDSDTTLPSILSVSERLKGFKYISKVSQTHDARFAAIPTADDFGTQSSPKGLYPALVKALKTVKDEISKDIKRYYSEFPVLQVIATQLLAKSVSFLEELWAFMAETNQQLTKAYNGSEKKAWDCVCKSIQDIWMSQFVPAKADMVSADLSDKDLLSNLCVWTSMKLTNAAEELSSVKLASHPDVSSSYVRFLIDHVGDEEATALKTANNQISNLKSELSETKRELTALKGHLTSIESRVDKLLNSKKK